MMALIEEWGSLYQKKVNNFQVYERKKNKSMELNDPHQGGSSDPPVQVMYFSDLDLLIAHRKGVCACTNHQIANFLSYEHLPSSHKTFISSLSNISLPRIVFKALSQDHWRKAMIEEMNALEKNQTWEMELRVNL